MEIELLEIMDTDLEYLAEWRDYEEDLANGEPWGF